MSIKTLEGLARRKCRHTDEMHVYGTRPPNNRAGYKVYQENTPKAYEASITTDTAGNESLHLNGATKEPCASG
jgi:hypothetical protein